MLIRACRDLFCFQLQSAYLKSASEGSDFLKTNEATNRYPTDHV
jgi:hypothetical protein